MTKTATAAKTEQVKRRLSLRLSEQEFDQLADLRRALERRDRNTVSLQAALREAILSAAKLGPKASKALDFERLGETRTEDRKRLDLALEEVDYAQLEELQGRHPDHTQTAVVLAAVRITLDQADASDRPVSRAR